MTIKIFELPIKTVSEANSTEHWTKKSKRHKEQAFFVRMAYLQYVGAVILPVKITMTRCASRELDSDNLQMAFKWIRDELSDLVFSDRIARTYQSKTGRTVEIRGRNDSDISVTWNYKQEKRRKCGIVIEFEFNP
jgi:hypothetical protein